MKLGEEDLTGSAVLETYEFFIAQVILRDREGKPRYDDALELWNNAQKKYPTYAMIYGHKGVLLYKMGRKKEALESLEVAVQSKVGVADSYYYLAKCYLEGVASGMGKPRDVAKSLFEETLRIDPKHAGATAELAVFK